MNNFLDYLEETVTQLPDKVAYSSGTKGITFKETYDTSRAIGSFLINQGYYKEPIVIFMNKSPETIIAFFGTVYSGNFYVPLDAEMPSFRIQLILDTLTPKAIICDEMTQSIVSGFNFEGEIFLYSNIANYQIDTSEIDKIYQKTLDIDPVYVVFTSGSTGIPKGVVACHRSIIDYIENLTSVLNISNETIFGLQSPLYFDACLKEIYSTLKSGATTYFVPKELFMMPLKLIEYLNLHKVNTICWVASALTIISSLGTFKKITPEYLSTVAFGSEIFPIKQFNLWRDTLPNTNFIHLYGPTEATGMSCYYKVERNFLEEERIPIGKPFYNTAILLLDEDNNLITQNDVEGEICIRGTCLTMGYYKSTDRTDEVFVQNPLNDKFPELIYRTGDLGKYNINQELVFISRKGYQIKHMGHRIELGEIELCVHKLEDIQSACAVYDNKIILYYVGNYQVNELTQELKKLLPRYMVPNRVIKLDIMPLTANGKIDRNLLKQQLLKK